MAIQTLYVGNVISGERDLVLTKGNVLPLTPGTLYVHGAEGSSPGSIAWMEIPSRIGIMNSVSRNSVMLCSDLRGNFTWGNNSVISAITSARSYLLTLPGVASGKINILAQSMGATAALAWAAQNPTLVNRIALIIPVINLMDVRNNSSYQADIDAAYGGSYTEAAYGATHNPLTMAQAGKFAGMNIKLWYGNSDALCKPEFSAQFVTATGAKAKIMGGGHSVETIANIDPEEVARFLDMGV